MNIRALLVAAGLLPCVGCVSVFEGTSQDIHVATSPAGATCAFERQSQNIGTIVSTPGVLTVRKNKYDITIRCDKPGYEQAAYNNHSGVSGAIAANIAVDILLTAGIASIIDSANGADNKYDSVVNLTMIPAAPQVVGTVLPTAPPLPVAVSLDTSSASPTPPVGVASAAGAAREAEFRCPRSGTLVQYDNGTTLKFSSEMGFRCRYVDQNMKEAEKFAGFADDAKFVDAGLSLLWPLSVGKQQTVSVSSSGAYLTHTFTVLRTERVATPAGTFDTFVVEEEETGTGAQRAKRLYWYAPEPGLTVKSTFTLLKSADTAVRAGTASATLVSGDYVATRIEGTDAKAAP
jgi:hypothetical protein